MENPWRVLGIPPNSSTEEIRAAYRDLAKRWHPDMHSPAQRQFAEAEFKRIQQAYNLLTGRERTYYPQWTSSTAGATASSAPRTGMSNKMAAGMLIGMAGISMGVLLFYNRYRRYRMARDPEEMRARSVAYTNQLQRWKDTLEPHEVEEKKQELRRQHLEHAVTEASATALSWGGSAAAVAAAIKAAEFRGLLGRLPGDPFFAFHLRGPVLFFYVSSIAATGFWVAGSQAISPKGSRHIVRADL